MCQNSNRQTCQESLVPFMRFTLWANDAVSRRVQSPKAAAGHMALLSEVFQPHGYLGTGYLTRRTAIDLVETETAKRGNGNHRQREDEQQAAGTRAQPGAVAVSLCRRAPTVKPAGPGGGNGVRSGRRCCQH